MQHEKRKNVNRRYGGFLKFAASSLIGFVADYGMYSLLVFLTRGLGGLCIPLSNIAARILSATLNFWINKRLVFCNRDRELLAGAKYAALAACILAGNTALLSFLVNSLGINQFVAKPLAEVTFFLVSWFVQKTFVFKKRVQGRAALVCRTKGDSVGNWTEERNG
jgi:putative flippase GtrA